MAILLIEIQMEFKFIAELLESMKSYSVQFHQCFPINFKVSTDVPVNVNKCNQIHEWVFILVSASNCCSCIKQHFVKLNADVQSDIEKRFAASDSLNPKFEPTPFSPSENINANQLFRFWFGRWPHLAHFSHNSFGRSQINSIAD